MEKLPGMVSIISAFRMAPPAVTEVDGEAQDDKKRSQEVLSNTELFIPIGCARALGQEQAYQLAL
jgi:hypothetical protein